jgi:hypothetical protein
MDWDQDIRQVSDDELWAEVSHRAHQWDPRDQKYVSLGLTELSLRSDARTREAIAQLKSSIDEFRESSDRYSRRICFLTWALVFLTLLLAVPAVASFIHFMSSHLLTR